MTLENLRMDDLAADCPECKGTGDSSGFVYYGPRQEFTARAACPGCSRTGKLARPAGLVILALLKAMRRDPKNGL